MRSIVFIRNKSISPSQDIIKLLNSLRSRGTEPIDWHYDNNYITFRVKDENYGEAS
jgi:hypothetical protein